MKKEFQKGIKNVKTSIEKAVTSDEAQNAVKSVVETTENVVQAAKDTAVNAVKKVTAKKADEKIYIQFANHEVEYNSIREKVIEAFKSTGNTESEITSFKAYIKPEENAVYYVINEEITGKVELF